MTVLIRPDTVYLFAHVSWKVDIAIEINVAISRLMGPKARQLQDQVEAYIAEADPFEEQRLRALPFFDIVEELKEQRSLPDFADCDAVPDVVLSIGGRDVAVSAWSPRRGCNFVLTWNGCQVHGRLGSSKPNSPNCYIEIGSAPLWSADDWRGFLTDWQAWLDAISQAPAPLKVSRFDIALHTQTIGVEDLDRHRFVCRADTRRVYTKAHFLSLLEKANFADEYARQNEMPAGNVSALIEKLNKETGLITCDWFKGEVAQMIGFGTRGRLYARIYNKTTEVSRNPAKSALFRSVWAAAGLDLNKDVFNVEFEMCRSWLNSRDLKIDGVSSTIDSLSDILTHFDKIVAYLLGNDANQGWLRMVDLDKSRRERSSTSEGWELLREATSALPKISLVERQQVLTRATASRLLPQVVKLKARMDVYLGRPIDGEDLSSKTILEAMAEILTLETNRPKRLAWSDFSLNESYRAEVARTVRNRSVFSEAV